MSRKSRRRFLFVLPPFLGHVAPCVSVGRELASRGHTVAWVAHPVVDDALPGGDRRFSLSTRLASEEVLRAREESSGRWMTGFKAFWTEVMLPMNREMLPQVGAAIEEFRPDLVVADQQAMAGGLAARQANVAWATSAATFAWATMLGRLPSLERWVQELLATLQKEAGLEPVASPDLSPALVIAYTTECLAGPPPDGRFLFVGAPVDSRIENVAFPWERLEECPRVFVSLGTVSHFRGAHFLNAIVEALADEPVQVIAAVPPELVSCPPRNFIVQEWVPQMAVLSAVDAVVSNAGFSTTSEVLSRGLPMVVAPIAYDSSIVADKVVQAGTGIRVRFYRSTPSELREAVRSVLTTPGYRQAAMSIRESFRQAGGASAAADALENLADSPGQPS